MGVVVQLHEQPTKQPPSELELQVERLLEEIRSGEVTGLAFVALQNGAAFKVGCHGRAKKLPVYTLGTICILKEHIATLVV
jgi:hypothetical protein